MNSETKKKLNMSVLASFPKDDGGNITLIKTDNNKEVRFISFDEEDIVENTFSMTDGEFEMMAIWIADMYSDIKYEDAEECEEVNEEDDEDVENQYIIDFRKFVVHTNHHLECYRQHHKCERIKAVAYVYKNGKTKPVVVNGEYCLDCNTYYITENEFENLKEQGILMCQVFSQKELTNYFNEYYRGGLKAESKFHAAGYTVGEAAGYSADERLHILKCIIESGIATKDEAIRHLGFLIYQNEGNKHQQNAVSKWIEDRNNLNGYRKGSERILGIKYIVE